jgi:hypothetical protein
MDDSLGDVVPQDPSLSVSDNLLMGKTELSPEDRGATMSDNLLAKPKAPQDEDNLLLNKIKGSTVEETPEESKEGNDLNILAKP